MPYVHVFGARSALVRYQTSESSPLQNPEKSSSRVVDHMQLQRVHCSIHHILDALIALFQVSNSLCVLCSSFYISRLFLQTFNYK